MRLTGSVDTDPRVLQANVLKPLPLPPSSFDSIGMNYLLHCVPGSMVDKSRIFPGLAALLAPGGVLFGSTAVNSTAGPRSIGTAAGADL